MSRSRVLDRYLVMLSDRQLLCLRQSTRATTSIWSCSRLSRGGGLLTLACCQLVQQSVNPLVGTLKPQSNGPLYINTVIGTLAVDGWAVTFDTVRIDTVRIDTLWPAQYTLFAVPNVNSPPINSQHSLSTSYYLMWHYNYLCLPKG